MATSTGSSRNVSNVVAGRVLHKESGRGVPNLLVELLDLDSSADPESRAGTILRAAATSVEDISALYKMADRIGSTITDAAGGFRFEATPKDFNLGGQTEQKPDLVLVVLAPDEPGLDLNKRVLHVTKNVYLNAGSSEAFIVRLPTRLLAEREVAFEAPPPPPVEDAVKGYAEARRREQGFNAGVAGQHAAEAAQEKVARAALRTSLLKKLATDFSNVPLGGVVATDGDDLRKKNIEVVSAGIKNANARLGADPTGGVPVNLYLTPADRADLAPYFGSATSGFVDIPEAAARPLLFRTNGSEDFGTLLVHNNPIASFCAAENANNKCAKVHTDLEAPPAAPPPPKPPPSDDEVTTSDILTYVDRLLRDVPAPDRVLRPDLVRRADGPAVEKSVSDFSLQRGPAEVPAFYDFHSLQIAFDHVWKQLFDEAIPNLAFTADTLGKAHFGIDGIVSDKLRNGLLATDLFFTLTPVEVPSIVARFFDVTKEEYNELSFTNRQELVRIANEINECTGDTVVHVGNLTLTHTGSRITDLRRAQAFTEQGERLIDAVRHDDYYTLHKTLRDLNERLHAKYEFTVFAADKDYHSVNFGLMNTYRQEWTPLMYQAGRLLKTIPLSPKEERKYSLKVTHREKRANKEAKKNNSSVTSERTSTSRVESDIMAKAQNKTTFGLSSEGEFDIGLYEGKATTTFGVEAQSESSQTRKDFREAVLKAVQEYKNETSVEVTTETEMGSETTESGSIVNPNDELAVTYLFYELQKRYRLSEKLHRVMPVVLVAQEMPSPDQITPAWVVANDWILNRYLLDDSFRPALRYLANNSVGDDFGLRELRKNLRQQRNLVDTLRIEFSSASTQADNRYRALEAAINKRIDAEEDETTDGFFSDVGDFFGGGGQDPEAMKARELAAKDAHQYALEKAEKIASDLKQEIATLHELTAQYNKTLQERLDNETRVKRLLVHIRNNIFYYMQAIWSLEPPDQRYLRLYKVQVPVLELASRTYRVEVQPAEHEIFEQFREPGTKKHRAFVRGKLKHDANGRFATKSLVEVADLDTLLGFKGNYMVFPMKEHNALTEFMAAPYIDSAFGAMDPDELSNVSLDEYAKYVCCLQRRMKPDEFAAIKEQLRDWLTKLMATPIRNGDEIVVPTGSLFIESLVDPNPILEDFKLKHRELDVYKVQEEVRRAGLENVRLAARLLNDEREDPDIEKKIVVQGNGASPTIDVDDA